MKHLAVAFQSPSSVPSLSFLVIGWYIRNGLCSKVLRGWETYPKGFGLYCSRPRIEISFR